MPSMNLFAGQEYREQICGHSGGRRGRNELRETYTSQHAEQIASGNWLYDTGSSNPGLCHNVEGGGGVGGCREVRGERDICTPMAD